MTLGDGDFTLSCGFYSHVGIRPSMEDRSAVLPNFLPHKVGFFAVFDGRNGEKVADFCANKFPEVLQEELPFNLESSKDWEATLHNTFIRVDTEVQATAPKVGSTAVAAVITSSLILVANCGDFAVLCRGKDAVALSVDHKPNRPDELARIEASGGTVIDWGGCSRVCGVLIFLYLLKLPLMLRVWPSAPFSLNSDILSLSSVVRCALSYVYLLRM